MKKLLSILLGLSLVIGTASLYAQQDEKKDEKKEETKKKKKKGKKKSAEGEGEKKAPQQ